MTYSLVWEEVFSDNVEDVLGTLGVFRDSKNMHLRHTREPHPTPQNDQHHPHMRIDSMVFLSARS